MDKRIVHERVQEQVRVDDPLIVTDVKAGVAKSPQLKGRVYIGITFEGIVHGDMSEPYAGDLVLTVELAEAMLEIVATAIVKAKEMAQRAAN